MSTLQYDFTTWGGVLFCAALAIFFLSIFTPMWLALNTTVGHHFFSVYSTNKYKLLGPKSDQHQFSPNNIGRSSRVKVMRITKLITKG